MGTEGENGGESTGGEQKPANREEASGPQGTFTQDDVNRIATRESREGKEKGRRELMKKLGVESEEDLQAILDNHRKAEEASKSEADKEREKARKDAENASAERAAARQERFGIRCERALLKEGVDSKDVSRLARLVDVEWDASQEVPDDEVFDDAVKELKKQMPQVFSTNGGSSNANGGPPGSDPGSAGGGSGKPSPPNTMKAGEDMLAKRHPKKETSKS